MKNVKADFPDYVFYSFNFILKQTVSLLQVYQMHIRNKEVQKIDILLTNRSQWTS